MIQRIQTLFLLAASVLMGLLVFIPMATIVDFKNNTFQFFSRGLIRQDMQVVIPSIPFLAIIILIAILLFLAVFLYKNRMRQIRICVFSMLLLIGVHGLFMYHSSYIKKHIDILSINYNITIMFPILSLILVYMASRAIRKDDRLVKSYDRIR